MITNDSNKTKFTRVFPLTPTPAYRQAGSPSGDCVVIHRSPFDRLRANG